MRLVRRRPRWILVERKGILIDINGRAIDGKRPESEMGAGLAKT